MRFVTVPSGSFMMGTPPGFMIKGEPECPDHRVEISSFELLSSPVTQAMWAYLMGSDPSHFEGDSNPVECVSWNDCQNFIDKLNELDPDHSYRLPSEAEWEYACRAGTTTKYYWGDRIDYGYCWFDENADSTKPVGLKKPNAWGLFDMSGNVGEWCRDSWHNNYKGAPTNGSAWETSRASLRVVRGGCWFFSAWFCRSADRGENYPGSSNRYLGFRPARSVR